METPIPEDFREINYDKKNVRTIFQDVDSTVPYAELVAQRYALEAALMTAVENGNVVKALESWNELHNSVAFLKRLDKHWKVPGFRLPLLAQLSALAQCTQGFLPL